MAGYEIIGRSEQVSEEQSTRLMNLALEESFVMAHHLRLNLGDDVITLVVHYGSVESEPDIFELSPEDFRTSEEELRERLRVLEPVPRGHYRLQDQIGP